MVVVVAKDRHEFELYAAEASFFGAAYDKKFVFVDELEKDLPYSMKTEFKYLPGAMKRKDIFKIFALEQLFYDFKHMPKNKIS